MIVYETNDTLCHYGVLGMKWGIRRGRTSEAYAKASKKLKKLDSRIEKKRRKATKASEKAEKRAYGWGGGAKSAAKARFKAGKAQYKVTKAIKRANKWLTKMDKTFSSTNVSLSAEQRALGKSYVNELIKRAEIRSI